MNESKPTCGWNEAKPYRPPESGPPVRSSEIVLPLCDWPTRDGKRCGMPAKYELGWPDEPPCPICSLHQSRASTLGWPTRKRQND